MKTNSKKWLLLLVVFVIVGFAAIAITSLRSNSSEMAHSEDNVVVLQYSHGVSSPDPEIGVLVCNEDGVTFEYSFSNGEVASNFGVLLFLDGNLQPYSTNEDQNVKTIHTVELASNEEKVITITFQPIATQNKTPVLHIAAIFDIIHSPKDENVNQVFLHHLSQTIPFYVHFGENKFRGADTQLEVATAKIGDLKMVVEQSLENLTTSELQLTARAIFDQSANIDLTLSSVEPVTYRIYLYENHTPCMWKDDEMYIDVTTQPGTSTTISLTVENTSNESMFYAIAVPMDIVDRWTAPSILKSNSIYLHQEVN